MNIQLPDLPATLPTYSFFVLILCNVVSGLLGLWRADVRAQRVREDDFKCFRAILARAHERGMTAVRERVAATQELHEVRAELLRRKEQDSLGKNIAVHVSCNYSYEPPFNEGDLARHIACCFQRSLERDIVRQANSPLQSCLKEDPSARRVRASCERERSRLSTAQAPETENPKP